ncbi:hypothetical protein SAMN05519103_05010 [Rhizobiales bacterium GAS113]|nr:hypothetical protein SAMN05519103_05010 [Rhizobiales bacterium GAS113]
MLRILSILLVLFGGAAAGLYSAKLMLDRNVSGDLVRAGPWEMRVSESLVAADPYAQAERARSGAIALASGEGFTLTANRDSQGEPLDGRCVYAIAGATPAARFWSITLFDEEGRPVANAARRQSFSSTELTRDAQGGFNIAVASQAQPGDWLPAPAAGGFVLYLRLYDTPIGAGAALGSEQVPTIVRLACA